MLHVGGPVSAASLGYVLIFVSLSAGQKAVCLQKAVCGDAADSNFHIFARSF